MPIGPASFDSSVGVRVMVTSGAVIMFCTDARTGAVVGSVAPNPMLMVAASPAQDAPTVPTSIPETVACLAENVAPVGDAVMAPSVVVSHGASAAEGRHETSMEW